MHPSQQPCLTVAFVVLWRRRRVPPSVRGACRRRTRRIRYQRIDVGRDQCPYAGLLASSARNGRRINSRAK